MRQLGIAFFLATTVLWIGQANADFLGESLEFIWNFNGHTEYFTAAEGPEGTFYGIFDVDIAQDTICLTKEGWAQMLSGSSMTIRDHAGAIDDFLGIDLTSTSGVPINMNDISFDTDSITIDFSETSWSGGEDFTLGVTFPGSNPIPGDLNGDGFVGGDDLDIVRANWGQGTPINDFMGESLQFTWNYNGHSEYFTATEGPEGTFYGKFDVDIENSAICLTKEGWSSMLSGATMTIHDHADAIDDFLDISLSSDSGVPIDISDVTFDEDSITVDFSNTWWDGGEDFTLDVAFSGSGVPQEGDLNGDGFVGGDDLDIVRAHWGQGAPPTPNAVPEPSLSALLTVGALTLLSRRRFRRRENG